jgi:hypothetical protein
VLPTSEEQFAYFQIAPSTPSVSTCQKKNVTISIHQTGTICHNDGEDHQRHLKGKRRAATVQREQIVGPSITYLEMLSKIEEEAIILHKVL